MRSSEHQNDSALGAHDPTRLQHDEVSRFDELKRSWWILLTLVPFGWLSFAAFFFIGHRAKEPSWKRWALSYFILSWAATVIASVEELSEPVRQAGGMVMLFVAWPVPFIHALRVRRPYLDRTSVAGTADGAAYPTVNGSPVDQAPLGKKPQWRGKRRSPWLAVAFGFFTLFGAIQLMTGQGGDRIWGLVTLLFFGLGGAAVYAPKAKSSGGIENADVSHRGRYQQGLVIEIDRRRHRIRTLACMGMGVAGGLMAVYAEEMGESGTRYNSGTLRVVGLLVMLSFGAAGLLALFKWSAVPRLALLREGVLLEVGSASTYVPWTAIESVGVFSTHGNEMLGFRVSNRSQIEAERLTRALLPMSRFLSPADLTQQLDAFVAEPEIVVATVEHYFNRAEERELLATGKAQAVRMPNGEHS